MVFLSWPRLEHGASHHDLRQGVGGSVSFIVTGMAFVVLSSYAILAFSPNALKNQPFYSLRYREPHRRTRKKHNTQ